MPLYIVLAKLTDEGRNTIKQNPEWIQQINREVEAMGVKVLTQYFLLGPYDFLSVLEAPSNEVVSKVAIELGSRGTLRTLTMPALGLNEFITTIFKSLDRYRSIT